VWWVLLFVGFATAGVVVLLLLTVRLWRQVRALGRTVAASSQRIADASAALEKTSAQRR
jgi:hypothetical protein